MKITNLKLYGSLMALRDLADAAVPVRTALKLRKMMRKAQEHLESYDQVRKSLVQRHTALNEKNEAIHPPGEDGKPNHNAVVLTNADEFNASIKELNEVEVELAFDQIDRADLGDVKIKPATLLALDWAIKDRGAND